MSEPPSIDSFSRKAGERARALQGGRGAQPPSREPGPRLDRGTPPACGFGPSAPAAGGGFSEGEDRMPELLERKVRPANEALTDLPVAVGEAVAESPELERSLNRESSSAAFARRSLSSAEVVSAAHAVAKEIDGCWEFAERLEVYKSVGERFKRDARRVLDAAAARWPELISWVNDLPEWKALLSADLS
jgi:hypothetical protein